MSTVFRFLFLILILLQTTHSVLAQGSPPIIWQKMVDDDRINAVVFTPDGNTLISGGSNREINFWRTSDGTLLRTLNESAPLRHESAIESLAITSDGKTLAAGTSNYVQLFDLPTGVERKIVASATNWIVGVAISPNNQYVASASFDTRVKIFQISNGALVKTLTNHTRIVRAVAFSPDGSLLVSASDDRTIRFWNTSNWALVRTITGLTDDLYSLAFSPDGTTIAAGGYDNTARVWNVSNGTLKYTFNGSGDVYGVDYSPDGSKLAFVDGLGNHLRLYNLSNGSLIRSYDVNDAQCLTFSKNGLLGFGITSRTVYLANILGVSLTQYTLQVDAIGAGTVTANPSPNGTGGAYLAGTGVTLTAVPTGTNGFLRWSGASSSTAKTITLTMNGNKSVAAYFGGGETAIYWQNGDQFAGWQMKGTGRINSFLLNPKVYGWQMVGQYNNNGQTDFLWHNNAGQLAVWHMNGNTVSDSAYLQDGHPVSTDWRVAVVTDFDNDGKADILWEHVSGTLAVWFMDSSMNLMSTATLSQHASFGWHMRGIGQFNGTGKKDFLWQHDNGQIAVWYMDGTKGLDYVGATYLNNGQAVSSEWKMVGVNDFDNDSKADILWQHASGYLAIWFMNNTSLAAGVVLNDSIGIGSSWHAVGTK